MSRRVLIVEDDATITRMVRDNLAYDGFDVDCAGDGDEAMTKLRSFAPDLVLLDLTLPRVDGLTVCRAIRATRSRTGIVIVTARNRNEDKVRGLELGADDYITKPFALEELLARVHAVLRRTQPGLERLALGSVVVDFGLHLAWKNGRELSLTTRELELLHYLADRRGQAVTRDELLRVIWGYNSTVLTRTVDNCVARLRRKIEADPHAPRFILTMYGDGYALAVP